MASDFHAVTDAFSKNLETIAKFVSSLDSPKESPSVRVAAVNSAVLLIAATFEEFVKEMATLSVRHSVNSSDSVSKIPTILLRTAWRRTFGAIADENVPQSTDQKRILNVVNRADDRTKSLLAFFRGDLTQEIYDDLVHNQDAMRVQQINSLFGISAIKDICKMTSENHQIIEHFKSEGADQGSIDLNNFIDHFIDHRNQVAHRLSSVSSLAPKELRDYVTTFQVFAQSLCETLEKKYAI